MKLRPYLTAAAHKSAAWGRTHMLTIAISCVLGMVALVPLYGVLFPPLVDLPEHLLISKLLWEKLRGISHLDLEISWFLAYRLFPALMMIVIPWCKLWGISLVSLPRIVAIILVSLHVLVVTRLLFSALKSKAWKSRILAAAYAMPAIVGLYSACWFIGFVNYVLAVTLLVPAIFLSEAFLRTGKLRHGAWLFLNLLLVYAAHPFAPAFWVFWVCSRGLAAMATGTFLREWKRLVCVPLVFLPILVYHFLATRGTAMAASTQPLLTQPAIVAVGDWYQHRFRGLFDGILFKVDDAADPKVFARFLLAFVGLTTLLAFCVRRNAWAKNLMLSVVLLIVLPSWLNEKFFPVPPGVWLAYDYRYVSTTYAIALVSAGWVLIRIMPILMRKRSYQVVLLLLAWVCIQVPVQHLVQVRKSYKRFDAAARPYMARVFRHEPTSPRQLGHTRWHPDGTFLDFYVCLKDPDCNPRGTTFYTRYVRELYPVKFQSAARLVSPREFPAWRKLVPSGPLVGHWKFDEENPADKCVDSSGNGNAGIPTGTTVVEGQLNRARSFNGKGDQVAVPAINIPNAITVSAWVHAELFTQNAFLVVKNPVNTQWSLFLELDGALKWRSAGFDKVISVPAPSNNAWHHIVAKQEGITASIYVDGVSRVTGALPPLGNAPGMITIGRFQGFELPEHYSFRGRIDDVRIYNRALSDAEIAELFALRDTPLLEPPR